MAEKQKLVHIEGTPMSMADAQGSGNFMAGVVHGNVTVNVNREGPGTSGHNLPPTDQRTQEMIRESILAQSREGERSSEEDSEIESDPQLREHLPFVDAGYTFVLEIWKTVEKKLSKREIRDMIKVYLEHYFEKRGLGKAKPLDADELYIEIKEKKIISNKNVIYIQILLWKINRKKLIVKVAKKAKEAFTSHQVKISHMDVPSLKPVIGCKFVRVHLDMTDQEVADVEHLHKIRREMARYLGVKPDFVHVVGLELTKSVWMTLIMPSEVFDQLYRIFYDPSLRKGFQGLKINTVIFQESTEEEDDDEDVTVYLWETHVSDPVPGPGETRKEEKEEYDLQDAAAQEPIATFWTDSEADSGKDSTRRTDMSSESDSDSDSDAEAAISTLEGEVECSGAVSSEEESPLQEAFAQEMKATSLTDSEADSGMHSAQRTDFSTEVESDIHTDTEPAVLVPKAASSTSPEEESPRKEPEKEATEQNPSYEIPSAHSSESNAKANNSNTHGALQSLQPSLAKPSEYDIGRELGAVSLLSRPQDLEKVYGRIKSMEDLWDSLHFSSIDVDSVMDLTGEAILLGHKLSMSMTEMNGDFLLEQKLIGIAAHFCSDALDAQEAEPVDILRLLASVLWLTRTCAIMVRDERNNCQLRCFPTALFHGDIWRFTAYHDTEKVMKYAWELEVHLLKRYEENPTIAFLLCQDIASVCAMFKDSREQWKDTSKKLFMETQLVIARCLLLKGFYRTAKSTCKTVLEELCDYDNPTALDIWSQALECQGAYEPAMLKAIEALKYAKGPDAERIRQRIEQLRTPRNPPTGQPPEPEREEESGSTKDASFFKVKTKIMHDEKKPRKKHRRPPPNPHNVSDWCVYGESTPIERQPSAETLVESVQAINIPDDDLVPECDNTDYSSSPVTVMTKSPLNPDNFLRRLPLKTSTEKTWYEESLNQREDADGPRVQDIEEMQLDPLELAKMTNTNVKKKKLYKMEKSEDRLKQLLDKRDRYKKCRISFNSAHVATCHVLDENSTQSIEIYGRSRIGQTFNDDEVVVEIVPSRRTGVTHTSELYGRVMGILKRHRHSGREHPLLACTIDQYESQLMHPLCKTVPKIHVLQPGMKGMTEAERRDRVEIFSIDANGHLKSQGTEKLPFGRREAYVFRVGYIMWKDEELYPLGVVLEKMESCKDFASGLNVLELQHTVHKLFPLPCVRRVEEQLSKKTSQPAKTANREDFTENLTFTIDPQGSSDLEDAVSFWEDDPFCVVGVHISDVSAVVEREDAVDVEARRRGYTFYSPRGWRPYPMLPEPLVHQLCSFLPGVKRPALSLLFRVNKKGQIDGEPEMKKTLICSKYRLTYQEAQDIIDDEFEKGKYPKDLTDSVKKVNDIAIALRKQRLKNAARFRNWRDLRLEGEEKDEDGRAHALVEELMIKTNTYIGKKLYAKFPKCTLLQSQDAPAVENIQKWLTSGGAACHFLVQMQDRKMPSGQQLSASRYEEEQKTTKMQYVTVRRDIWLRLQTALDEANMREINRILSSDECHPHQMLTFKSWKEFQERAVHRSSSEKRRMKSYGTSDNGHFTLDRDAYCHFTSPIRRYADIICHRLLKCHMEKKSAQITPDELEQLAEDLRKRDLQRRAFQQSARDLRLADSLQDTPVQVTAVVGNLSENGFELLIPGMQNPPFSLREVTFKLLTLSKQPELVNTVPQSVRCQWRRRVYHTENNPAHEVKELPKHLKNLPVQVNENHMVVEVTARQWGNLLTSFLSDDGKRLKAMQKQARSIGPEGEVKQRPNTRNNISCESGSENLHTQIITFERNFAPGQAVHVQLGAGRERGMLVPRISLLWVSDNLHICLDHVREPVLHFASVTLLPSLELENLEEYVSYWTPLLEIEAVVASVQEDPGIVVEHVEIHFNLESGGTFTLPTSFCVIRCLDLGGRIADDIGTSLLKIESECVCIRIPVIYDDGQSAKNPALKKALKRKSSKFKQRTRAQHSEDQDSLKTEEIKETPTDEGWIWVGHGTIAAVCRKDKDNPNDRIEVFFHLNKNGAPPPPSLLTETGAIGVVEILPAAKTERRVMQSLQTLLTENADDGGNNLISAIVLGRVPPNLSPHRLQCAEQIEKELVPTQHRVSTRNPSLRQGREPRLPPNNRSQRKAIEDALTSTFSLIQGPPGTGKSYTGVKLIYLFHQINRRILEMTGEESKIIFCGPSNKSVDVVARIARRHLSHRPNCPRFVRVYGSVLEDRDYPVPGKINPRKGGLEGEADPTLRDISLHHLIRKEGKKYAADLAKFDDLYKPVGRKIDPNIVGELRKKYRKLVFRAALEELDEHDVIFCTCSVAGNKRITRCKIFQVIIDECGMCPEPHCLLPVIANNAKQVVLIGDHKQLRPIIRSRDAADLGLETSLFERLAEQASFLDTQYRMHPALCFFPSETFYEGKLQTGRSMSYGVETPLTIWPYDEFSDTTHPHVFVHVDGEERSLVVSTEEGNEMSRSNDQEVAKVVQIVLRMLREQVPPNTINVMSQYNAQCNMLRKAFRENKIINMNVNTVVASQGGEWDYVVFSTVRSLRQAQIEDNPTRGWSQRHLGFITDQNQINVALTRARKGLIIVGNSHLLRKDPVWQQLIDLYESMGCWVDGQLFPPPMPRPRFYQPPATHEWQETLRRY